MKKVLYAILITIIITSLVGCGGAESNAPAGPIEATDGATVQTDSGRVTFSLSKMYVGDSAFAQLESIGENPENFNFNDDPAYQTILYEYKVTVEDGEFYGDGISGQFYKEDQESKINDFLCFEFSENAKQDMYGGDIEMKAGDSDTLYVALAMPSDLTEYYDELYNGEWVHYEIKNIE